MRTKKRILLVGIVILMYQLFISGTVAAKEREYPEKAVRFLVGYAPGSVFDLSARALSKVAPKYLGKPLVVVNMPGAASTVALNELVKSTPDGYTIASASTGYSSTTIHQQKVPFDPKIPRPVLGYWDMRHGLFVRADSPYARLEELIDYGKKVPGGIKYGHSGKGIVTHLMGMALFKNANVTATDVPYKGSNDVVQAVIGGHILSGVTDISAVKQHVGSGTLKLVVVFLDERAEDFPEVPSSKEKGYVDVSVLNPIGFISIHKDTPLDRVETLHRALKKTIEDTEFREIMANIGQKCRYISPEMVEEKILKSERLGVPLLKELNLFVQ